MKKSRIFTFIGALLVICLALTACAGNSHAVSKTWKMDKDEHWHTCTDCEELFDKAPHEMEITEIVEVTCTTDGYVKHECKVCGYFYKDVTVATGHELVKTTATDADCVTNGNSEYYYCEKCHKYYSDEAGEHEIAENAWIITASGHTLTKVEATDATITAAGNDEYYTCSVCHRVYSDQAGTNELTGIPVRPQLVSSVAQAKNAEVGTTLMVRGIVVGVAGTYASANMTAMTILKDESSNIMMGLSGGVGDASKLSSAMKSGKDITYAYPKGTIIEMPVTVTKSTASYPCGNIGIIYLKYNETGEELSTFDKGMAESYAFDFTDTSIQVIDNQPDFFKFLGLMNGSNVFDSEGFEYNGAVAGANAYKLIKCVNMEGVKIGETNWRPVWGAEYNTWAKTSISNSASATNKIGAKQSFYPNFNNTNTLANTGSTFESLVFGDTSGITLKDWNNHTASIKDFYCIMIGGSDYYAQFVILDSSWVIDRA